MSVARSDGAPDALPGGGDAAVVGRLTAVGTSRRPRPAGRPPWSAVGFGLAGSGAGLGVAAAWIPLRQAHPNVDVALALVAVMTGVGVIGRRAAVVGAAAGSAAGFTFFDTQPYDHLAITRGADMETAVLLVVVGLATGELARRVAHQRRSDVRAGGDLGRVRDAADRLAHGEELVVMIGAVADQITRLLGLRDCSFSAEDADAVLAYVERDGTLHPPPGSNAGPPPRALAAPVALPVWSQGEVVGRFVMTPGPPPAFAASQLLVAVTLADQVGAALAAQAPLLPAPAGDGGHQPRPAGAGGHQPRPAGDGGHQPRPAGAGGHQQGPRPAAPTVAPPAPTPRLRVVR